MKNIVVSLACVLLAACTTTKTTQLGSNVHRIDMRSTAFVDAATANDKAFLRAAETTLEAGHRYFALESFLDTSRFSQIVTPGSTTTSVTGSSYNSGGFNNFNATATSTSSPSTVNNIHKPGSSTVISTYKTPPSGEYFDAYEVIKYYGPRLNKDKWTPSEIERLYQS
ncbi:hypothetical protein [Litorimonas sp.]|uniref:hypothetical protein n=1 Tax=Litorimonas sp. TaxID=1892381 RepID=UPI003A83EF48